MKYYDYEIKPQKETYEVRQLDCLMYDDSWTVNNSWQLGFFSVRGNSKRAFIRFLHKQGIFFKKGRIIIDYQDGGEILELQDRKTKEPLFVAIYSIV